MTRTRPLIIFGGLLLAGALSSACGSCGAGDSSNKAEDKDDNGGKPHAQWDGGRRVFKAFGDGGHHYRGRHLGDGGPSSIEGPQPE